MKRLILNMLLEMLKKHSVNDHKIAPDAYLAKDLEVVGDDFRDLLDDVIKELNLTIRPQNYDEILDLVPSEATAIFSFLFASKKREVTVNELAKIILSHTEVT